MAPHPGWNYLVEYTDDLPAGNWLPLSGGPHNSGTAIDKLNAGIRMRFYRLILVFEQCGDDE